MQDQIQDTINAYGVKLDATFLPASSFDDEWRSKSINHAITLTRGGRCIQAIYSQGVAHQPHYKQGDNSVNHHRAMELSIEKGNAYRPRDMDRSMQFAKALPNPSVVDVLWSLLMDSNGELSDFADFCGELGYETGLATGLQCISVARGHDPAVCGAAHIAGRGVSIRAG